MKSKSFVLMTLSLGFGLIAALGITQVMGKNKQPKEPKVKMGQVVVAVEHLGHKVLLDKENVRVENWPEEIIPENAVRSLEAIEEMAIMTRLSKGLPILKSDIVHKNKAMGIDIPPGFKVVAIKVSSDDTIAGLLRPGDRVDVIGLFKNRERGKSETVSRTFLKGLQVFSVNSSMKATTSDRSKGGSKGSAIVGVLVNEKQSEDIVYVQKTGSIKLVLRGDEPTEQELEDVEGVLARALNGKEEQTTEYVEVKKPEYEKMVIWVGQDYETVTFEPGRVPKAAFAPGELPEGSSRDNNAMSNGANPGNSDVPEDINNELEEDQYPVE
jgi:pilus assembly protein CpaB